MLVDAVLGYLDKVSRFDARPFTPLFIGGERMGCVNGEWKERLLRHEAALFEENFQGLFCRLGGSYRSISHALAQAARRWQQAGWLNGWRNENFTAFRNDGSRYFELERAAFRPLGLTSRAVHVNGLCRMADGEVRMWVGRRSPHKAVDPNRMDNLVGGGVAAGETLALALEREAWEEAGVSREQVDDLRPVALLLAQRPVARGLHREWLYVYDLWLEPGAQPLCQDGEVAEHLLLPLEEVERLLVAERFMIDAALVCLDALCRLGYWGARNRQVADALARVRHDLAADTAQPA
ncbi:DUF4743 domain-containing protein [Chromobacterium sp. ATCC 53434]|uniref:NUDIX hydrolase n=1 Tax=Chromobacterium sp. (strain ATCC 53434 / SC 14030) TaxID=2059672 RepID=UPI000C793178|nr:DUF4743 domain-containing protein [Chromobacterium sp. ATCC 53434]AUH52599.1 DUF4743 domain-containing protein [Chromobacterium sp. ATCC 53434]